MQTLCTQAHAPEIDLILPLLQYLEIFF